eukprot:1950796-Ditylum_brightwellii.AAC.1
MRLSSCATASPQLHVAPSGVVLPSHCVHRAILTTTATRRAPAAGHSSVQLPHGGGGCGPRTLPMLPLQLLQPWIALS